MGSGGLSMYFFFLGLDIGDAILRGLSELHGIFWIIRKGDDLLSLYAWVRTTTILLITSLTGFFSFFWDFNTGGVFGGVNVKTGLKDFTEVTFTSIFMAALLFLDSASFPDLSVTQSSSTVAVRVYVYISTLFSNTGEEFPSEKGLCLTTIVLYRVSVSFFDIG